MMESVIKVDARMRALVAAALASIAGERTADSGQGTTEYAILVGVLVVIAILAVTVFRGRLQELWNAIASGINSL